MHTCKVTIGSVLGFALLVLTSSCGGSGNMGGGGASSTFVRGKWSFGLFSSSSNMLGPTAELDMNLNQSGETISSDNRGSVDSVSCAGMHMDSSTGTISGDKINLVFSIDSEKITLDATLAPGGTAVGEANLGSWSAGDGPCLGGQHGIFNANLIPSLTGTSTGMLNLSNINSVPSVTAMLAEDSNFNISGSMAVTDDPCFSSLAISPTNLGMSVGSLSSFEMTDGTNVADVTGQIFIESLPPSLFNAQFGVISGCTEEFGGLTLNLNGDDAPAATQARTPSTGNVSAPKINPLLVERMKSLLAARRQNEQ
jgi:hypothetical protein